MTKVYSCLEIRKIYWYTVIIGISVKAGMRKSPGPLVRVAVMAILNSVISFISYKYTDLLTGCNYFSVGGLSEVGTENLAVTFIIVSVSFLICMVFSRETDALMPGGSIALSLGG